MARNKNQKTNVSKEETKKMNKVVETKTQESKVKEPDVVENEKTTNVKEPETDVKNEETGNTEKEPEVKEPVKKKLTPAQALKQARKLEDLLEAFKGDGRVGKLLNVLARYKRVNQEPVLNQKTIASEHYQLFTTITSFLKDPDYNKFKLNMDILNKVFLIEKDLFNPVTLNRFDYTWPGSVTTRLQYAKLIKYFSMMAHPAKRKENRAKVSLGSIKEFLPEAAVSNVSKYYRV